MNSFKLKQLVNLLLKKSKFNRKLCEECSCILLYENNKIICNYCQDPLYVEDYFSFNDKIKNFNYYENKLKIYNFICKELLENYFYINIIDFENYYNIII